MHNLANFTLHDMTACGAHLRNSVVNATSMEMASRDFVNYLYENLSIDKTDEKACAMVRFYRTLSYGQLDETSRDFARKLLGGYSESPEIKCLTLLASAGDSPEWNDRKKSRGHRVIPLPSENVVEQAPMIAQLIKQLGMDIHQLLRPDSNLMIELEKKSFNVFYVPTAEGSHCIPAQEDFVIPFKIKSVLGFGGALSDGDIFAIIMFSKASITQGTADMFKTIALNVKLALLPFLGQQVFDS